MLVNVTKLALVAATVALFTTNADAQTIDPRCAKAPDKVRCSCIFIAGGFIEHRPARGRVVVVYTAGQAEAVIACLKRHGRQ